MVSLTQKIIDGDADVLAVVDTVKKSSEQGIAAVQSEITVVANDLTIASTKIDGVYAQVNPPLIGSTTDLIGSEAGFAGVWSEQSARIENDMALGIRIDTTAVQIADVQAFAQQEVTARIEGDKATVEKIDTYIASNDSALATVRNSATTAVNQSSANAQQISSINLELGNKASTGALNQVKSDLTAVDSKVTANTTMINGVYAQVNPPLIGSTADLIGSEAGFAGVWSEQSARIENDMAQSIRTDQVVAQIASNDAIYQQQIKANADAISANVTATSTLQTTVAGNTASIQAQQQSINGINLQYTLKLDSRGYVSGIGMMNDGKTSNMIINADMFALGNPAGSTGTTYPFIFRTSAYKDEATGTVFPVAAYMKSAFFDYASIKTAHIEDGAISNLKIGNVIQSNDYEVNKKGWKIDKTGTLELNSSSATTRVQVNGQGFRMFNSSGVAIIEIGDF